LGSKENNMTDKRLTAIFLVLIVVLAMAGTPAWASLLVRETPLAPDGNAYDLNLDSQGTLWISDSGAGEIRSFDPVTGAYTAYPVGGQPSDARSDGAGSVWWADYSNRQLRRLSTSSTSTNQVTTWQIPNSLTLYSTALDSSGAVWVSDRWGPSIYKLDPDTNDLCTHALPNSGVSDHLYASGDQLWFGDATNARLVRLRGDTFDWWNLPAGSHPRDLELDGKGQLWWTDPGNGYVGLLDSDAAEITTFTPPTSGEPQMLALFGGKVWYSQQDPGQVVVLDPAVAISETTTVTTGTLSATPSCSGVQPDGPNDVTPISGQAGWTVQTQAPALDEAGWTIYALPENSAPWGIGAAGRVWLVDQGRQMLLGLSPATGTYLPVVLRQ
jgi:streptogramin lyase